MESGGLLRDFGHKVKDVKSNRDPRKGILSNLAKDARNPLQGNLAVKRSTVKRKWDESYQTQVREDDLERVQRKREQISSEKSCAARQVKLQKVTRKRVETLSQKTCDAAKEKDELRSRYRSEDGDAEKGFNVKLDVAHWWPMFQMELKEFNLTGSFLLPVPTEFAYKHFPAPDPSRPARDQVIIIEVQDSEALNWELKYLIPGRRFIAGWRRFATDHDLVMGDIILFEMIKPRKFRIHITRVSEDDCSRLEVKNQKKQEKQLVKNVENSKHKEEEKEKQLKIQEEKEKKVKIQEKKATKLKMQEQKEQKEQKEKKVKMHEEKEKQKKMHEEKEKQQKMHEEKEKQQKLHGEKNKQQLQQENGRANDAFQDDGPPGFPKIMHMNRRVRAREAPAPTRVN